MFELTVDHIDAISGGAPDVGEVAVGGALIVNIAADNVAVAGLTVVGALLGATHTKG